jgi:Zn-dependent M28 family amino/carboxypeptidase
MPGSDPSLAGEHILIDAHYDHVGIGPVVAGDSVYNGADDDASGVVATLKTAEILVRGPRPRRTIYFAAMTAEESGLLGARWFVDHPPRPLSEMVANLEIEMIGRPDSLAGGFGKAWLTGYERSTMGDLLAAQGIPLVADPRPAQNFFQRSDNYQLALRGVVAHTLSSFNLHSDYHRPSDETDKVDPAHITEVIRATARAARLLADGVKPEWKPGGRPERTAR